MFLPLARMTALTLLIISWAQLSAAAEPTATDRSRRQVIITLPQDRMNALAPEDQARLRTIAQSLMDQLWTWDAASFDTAPPNVSFAPNTNIIPVSDLFAPASNDEVHALGQRNTKLTAEQIEQIRQTGIFKVPSEQYPGLYHIWKVTAFFQKGSDNIEMTWKSDKAEAHDHIYIGIPLRLFGETPISIRHGWRRMKQGVYGLIDLLGGLSDKDLKYSDNQIHELVRKMRADDLSGKPERLASVLSPTGVGIRIVQEILSEIESASVDTTSSESQKLWEAIVAELESQGVPEDQIYVAANAKMERALQDRFLAAVLASDKLKTIDPSLPARLHSFGHVLSLLRIREQEFALETQREAIKIGIELAAQSPIHRRSDPSWLRDETERRTRTWYRDHVWTMYDGVVEEAKRLGYTDGAAELEDQLAFLKADVAAYAEQLQKELTPVQVRHYDLRIWRPSKWKIAKDSSGGYHLKNVNSFQIRSEFPGWRLADHAARAVELGWNASYALMISNLWNGPLGIRSFFGLKGPFQYQWEVNQVTGELEQTEQTRDTLLTRISAVRSEGARIMQDQRQRTNFGSMGRTGFVAWTWFYSIFGMRYLAPVALTGGQGALTLFNAGVSSALTIGSIVWAPVASILQYGTNVLIVSRDSFRSQGRRDRHSSFNRFMGVELFPAVHEIVVTTVGGVETVTAAVGAVIWHPASALGRSGGGWLRKYIRTGWDSFIRRTFIARNGTVPAQDSIFERRISGPGLDRDFFYSVKPSIALGGLLAELEMGYVQASYKERAQAIQQPARDAEALIQTFGLLFGAMSVDDSTPAMSDILQNATNIEKKLEANFAETLQTIGSWNTLPRHALNRVRLEREDLEALQTQATALTKAFVEQKWFATASGEQKIEFWGRFNLQAGQWSELANQLLKTVFGQNILTPLDGAGNSFVIAVRDPQIEDWISGMIDGYTPRLNPAAVDVSEQDPAAAAGRRPQINLADQLRPQVRIVGARDLCDGLLLAVSTPLSP